ncbi:integrase [Streptomyces sp. NPDC048331]|uniref:integrase n=1 Tax=Streptomyces sp. NPDC048331 TaxID=3365534 RepID=UPI003718FFE5
MTTAHATIPVLAGRHPFHGLPVIETAGLRRKPGSPRPVFDQDVWDLTGLADAPVVMSTHRKILDFTAIANPRWRHVAREYLMARLAPLHPAVATLPQAFRAPLNPSSLWHELKHLALWFNHLTTVGVSSLTQVRQHHCDAYLAAVSRSTTDPDRLLSPATTVAMARIPQFLTRYAEILSDGYRPDFTPWPDRSADEVTGYVRGNENRVPPVPDTLLRPLLANCLYLVETIGPSLTAEAAAARAADHHEAASRRGLLVREIDSLRDAVERRREAGIPASQAFGATITQRLKSGWDPDDPLLHMSWHPFVVETASAMGHRRDLERLRPELERWVAECGLQQPWCRNAALVPRHNDGELMSWAAPMARHQLDTTVYAVTSAAYLLTSALSGMRASELAELTSGCRRHEQRPGGGTRYRLVSRRIKGEAFGGAEDAWVVIEDVHRAIGTAEALTGAAPGQRLFAKASNNSNSRYTALRSWVNGEHGQRLGLEPIPEGPVNPRALRRTLAMSLAQRPHGLMATKLHLKHLSVATAEGYAARPGGHQAAFAAEVAAEEEAEHLRLTVAAYEDYQRGVLPSGKGARELIAAFKTVDQALERHDAGPVTVIDDRRVERVLKVKAKTLHLGVGNYCWFSDPGKALCLKLAGTPNAAEPLMGLCDSARCPQATHHPQHRQIWADHADNTQAVFLGNPRLSKPERARAKAAFDRATRVVAEIDAAAHADEELVHDA